MVGPNGSGKSNISDAILWVLGEQSAKMLRGQAMEDVIFSGSSGRQAVGLAEVTLVLDNSDHTIPLDFAEFAITRRMYRSGESEYLINGAPARLRDITDILHDSGLGKDTHSIISQGKLDSILASRPEERRELVEEAAGISKHRRRKERSERKLVGMQENLNRAKDIQREIHRQLKPLERQVDKAKRHRALQDELTKLSTTLAVDDLRQLQARYRILDARAHEAEAAIELAQYRFDEKNKELEKYQSLLEQKGIFVGDLGEQRRRMQAILGRMDSDMRLLEEKGKNMVSRVSELRMSLTALERQSREAKEEHENVIEELGAAKAQSEALQEEVFDLEPALNEARNTRRQLGAQLSQLSNDQRVAQREADQEMLAYAKLKDQISNAEVEDSMFASRLAQIEDALATAEEALELRQSAQEELEALLADAQNKEEGAQSTIQSCREALDTAHKNEQSARSRLSSAQATLEALMSVDAQSENSSELIRALSTSASEYVDCRLADLIEAPQEYESIIEALLGDDLAALVAPSAEALDRLTELALKQGAQGKATLAALDAARLQADKSFEAGAAGDGAADQLPGVSLYDCLKVREDARALLEAICGKVRLVESIEEARAAHDSYPSLSFMTKDALLVRSDGRIVVGMSSAAEHGALERKRRIRTLKEELPQHEVDLSAAQAAIAEAESQLSAAREASAQAKGDVARLHGELASAQAEIGRLQSQLNQAHSEQAQVMKSRLAAQERAAAAKAEVEHHHQLAEEASERAVLLGEDLERLQRERAQASQEESACERKLNDAKLRLATVVERRNHLSVREVELARQQKQFDERLEQTQHSAAALDVMRLRIDPLHERYDAVRERALAWAARLKDRASLAEADSDSLKRTISEARDAAQAAGRELDEAKDQESKLKLEMGKLEVEVEHAINQITQTGQLLEEALELPEPEDRVAMERRVERLRKDIDHIGPVNEVAMDEYSKLKERADYISEQVEDLETAKKSLQKITAAIERKMRRQFLVIFDQVNANFSEIFALLFPGGQAHLELTDPDHVDETGVEIVAQPRGKKIQKMTLMSGGEKSLTALALLFAVYRTRTVPFYVFDEVEAALDDANLSKLLDAIEQLKDTTQLIVISHQRRTMEQADVLYGVSMQADGVSHVVSQRLDKTTGKVVDA